MFRNMGEKNESEYSNTQFSISYFEPSRIPPPSYVLRESPTLMPKEQISKFEYVEKYLLKKSHINKSFIFFRKFPEVNYHFNGSIGFDLIAKLGVS